jgi:hypothetical protein
MKRRFALKQLALAAGAAITLPSWANEWSKNSLPSIPTILSSSQEALLGEIVEAFIPKTDTPGAKELGVHKFINVMLTDCYEKEVQDTFSKTLSMIDEASTKKHKKTFTAISPAQRLELLKTIEKNKEIPNFSDLKESTVFGYLNSEYVMKNLLKYELVPARFDGCFPVKNKN